jgi:hypothetical protein
VVVLFIDHDQREIGGGSEYGTTSPATDRSSGRKSDPGIRAIAIRLRAIYPNE